MKKFIMLFLLPVLVFAEKDTLKVWPFNPVVVTGTRVEMEARELPFTISQVPEKVIEEQSHVPLLDLVSENVPNLFVTQRTNIGYGVASGAAGGISLRGVGGSPTTGVLVLIDGRPDIMGMFGHPLSDAYFLHDIEKIEVQRGPASLLYGSNAMGGAINIITKHNHNEGYHASLPIHFGSFNTSQISLNQTYGNGKWDGSLSMGYHNSDGYREKGRDDYTSKSGNLQARYSVMPYTDVTFNSYLNNYYIYDPGQVTAPVTDHWYDIQRFGGDITFNHSGEWLESDVKIHYNAGDHQIHDNDDVSADSANFISDDYTIGLVINETWYYAEKSRLTAGIDLRQYGGEANSSGTVYKETVNEYSGLINAQHQLLQCLFVNGGIRYTVHSTAEDLWIPAAGFSWLLPKEWTLKMQYAEGYRNPTINNLYMFNPANDKLLPETSQNIEMTIEKRFYSILNASLTVFNTNVENMIIKSYVPELGRPLNQNTGSVEITGAEIEGQLLLPPSFAINWSAGYSYFSEKILNSPKTKLNLGVRYQPMHSLNLSVQMQYIDGLYSDDNPYDYVINPVALDDYFLLNCRSSYDFPKHLSLFAEVNNLLNTEYETLSGFPMPGINFTIGLTAKY